ncbi:MAG: hypothetical protein CL762_00415 [Chloroflexi bacterium]|nr:hypothetical protein [Chloroflexota bacterium]|tara:strand:+ start:23042 stop:24502 length:1461 start_codon:yes stop_codon:yes gene_type:complete
MVNKSNNKNKVIIIGAGLGGICTALRLSKIGYKVSIIEKNESLGGKITSFSSKGYKFDQGPSLITLPDYFDEFFKDIGENINEHIELIKLNPMCRYFFDDGNKVDYFSSLDLMKKELDKVGEDFQNFYNFLSIGAKIYELSDKTFLNFPMGRVPKNIKIGDLIKFPYLRTLMSYKSLVNKTFSSPKIKQIFERYPTYVGSSPENTPGMLFVIPYIEYAFGSWYIKGGIYKLIESLEKLLVENEVEIIKNCVVKNIQISNNKITGVETSKGQISTKIVINNTDISNLNKYKNQKLNENIDDYSLSGFVLMLGLKKKIDLKHHNIIFSKDYKKEFDDLFKRKKFPEDPTIYVCNPTATDESVAPQNCSNLFIMANSPATSNIWTDAEIELARNKVLNKLKKINIHLEKSIIDVEKIQTPNYFMNQHNSYGGSLYGKNSHGIKNSFFRHPNKEKTKGLYNVGGTTHPGGGTPTVIKSSKITTDLIKNDY